MNFGFGSVSHGPRHVFGIVFFGIAAAFSAWIAFGQFRAVCIVGSTNVLVRNTFSTTNLDRGSVIGVAVRPVRLGWGPYFAVRLQCSGRSREMRIDSLEYLPKGKADNFASEVLNALKGGR